MSEEIFKIIFEEFKKNGIKLNDFEYRGDTFIADPLDIVNFPILRGEDIRPLLDFSEHDKPFEDRIAKLENRVRELEMIHAIKIDEVRKLTMKISELKSELESKRKDELPFDALETANYLINATYERETSGLERAFAKVPDKVNDDRYTVDELEQIAEHLLVYCKHNRECDSE